MLVYLGLLFLALCLLIKLYLKLTTGWCKSQTCLVGKTAIITGANTGIGYETAIDFAKRGARVILACRNREKAIQAQTKIVEETENENVIVKIIDMASFESVRAFAREINETEKRLDILVNNAGLGGGHEESKTVDGHSFLMQVNYLSSFLLTHLLLGLMKKTPNSRIVNVSSNLAKQSRHLDVANLGRFSGIYDDYYNSKLCNILFTIELAERLHGTGVTTYSVHPGPVRTDIFQYTQGGVKLFFYAIKDLFFKTSEEGAQTTIHCAVAKEIEAYSGEHFKDCRKIARYKTATVPGLPKKVWEKSEEIVHLKPKEMSL